MLKWQEEVELIVPVSKSMAERWSELTAIEARTNFWIRGCDSRNKLRFLCSSLHSVGAVWHLNFRYRNLWSSKFNFYNVIQTSGH